MDTECNLRRDGDFMIDKYFSSVFLLRLKCEIMAGNCRVSGIRHFHKGHLLDLDRDDREEFRDSVYRYHNFSPGICGITLPSAGLFVV